MTGVISMLRKNNRNKKSQQSHCHRKVAGGQNFFSDVQVHKFGSELLKLL